MAKQDYLLVQQQCMQMYENKASQHEPWVIYPKHPLVLLLHLHTTPDLHFLHFLHFHRLLLLPYFCLAAAPVWLTFELLLALPCILGLDAPLFELPSWKSPRFLVFVDNKASSGYLESQLFYGLGDRHPLLENQFDQQHSFLHQDSRTFMGIFEYLRFPSPTSKLLWACIVLIL
jgi:hypothetical protein